MPVAISLRSVYIILVRCLLLQMFLTFIQGSEHKRRLSWIREEVDGYAEMVVPSILHQTYDYPSPSYFLYMSILTAHQILNPIRHILWVNIDGRFRRGHWQSWQDKAVPGSWQQTLVNMIQNGTIEAKLVAFPIHPPGNSSIYASNKAHHSDFMRMEALRDYGGMYLDTDVITLRSLDPLRIHDFSIGFDNVVHPDQSSPDSRRCNNGVLLSVPNATFLRLWSNQYNTFNPSQFGHHSSVVPFQLAVQYPDLVHVEMSRLSPVAYGLQTSEAAAALTCGLLLPDLKGIWYPCAPGKNKPLSFHGAKLDKHLYRALSQKYVLHLTMSGTRGSGLLRQALGPESLPNMPSFLGRAFRFAAFGKDNYNYTQWSALFHAEMSGHADSQEMLRALEVFSSCRSMLGLSGHLDPCDPPKHRPPSERQQFVASQLP